MLQSKGKQFTSAGESFRSLAREGEEVLAVVLIGFRTWVLTKERLVELTMTAINVKSEIPLSRIQGVRFMKDRLGQNQLFLTELGQAERKLGTIADVEEEFLQLIRSLLDRDASLASQDPSDSSFAGDMLAPDINAAPEVGKRIAASQKKAARMVAREKKREQKIAQKAADEETYGREILTEMLGFKAVAFFEKGFVKVNGQEFEKLLGIEGSADNLQKKSAAGRAAGFVFTGGLNMLGSNKRGDLFITISTDKGVHSLHTDAPYAHDVKSYQRIIGVGKSLLARPESPEESTRPLQGISEEIERLAALRDSGVLSEDEFQQAKARIFAS